MESELYKQRSLSRCLNDAYNLYRTNFKTIIRRIWLPSLILSLLTAATYLIYANGLMALASANLSVGSGIALSVLCLLSACAYVWIFTIIISLLNGKSVKANLPRMIRLALAVFGLMIVVCAFIGLVSMAFVGLTKTKPNTVLLTGVLGAAVACVVAYVLALPLCYSIMKYCIETEEKVMAIFKRNYLSGWHQWGFLFIIALLVGIIVMVIDTLVGMPNNILSIASGMRHVSMMEGDSPVVPSTFGLLTFLTATACTFVMVFVRPWVVFVFYYAYGCIDEKEKARLALRKADVKETASKDRAMDFEEVR
uniref:hypothetical protein n=1 Tax=Prevotella sp. TaxID=59823 RepID=UPI0040296067